DVTQVGHILRGPAHCVRALETRPHGPVAHEEAIVVVLDCATSRLSQVLRRYPRVPTGRGGAAGVTSELDGRLCGVPGEPQARLTMAFQLTDGGVKPCELGVGGRMCDLEQSLPKRVFEVINSHRSAL